MCVFVLCAGVLTHVEGSLPYRDPIASHEEDFKSLSAESQALAGLTSRPECVPIQVLPLGRAPFGSLGEATCCHVIPFRKSDLSLYRVQEGVEMEEQSTAGWAKRGSMIGNRDILTNLVRVTK